MNGISFYISTVKKMFRILGITLLTVLYCFTISMAGDITQHSGLSNKSTIEKEKNDVTVSIKFFSNTSQAESLSEPTVNNAPSTLKNSFNEFSAIARIKENFIANTFSQYISISRNFLIKYLKANIIFPFHYFW